jgi:hypothetical protein
LQTVTRNPFTSYTLSLRESNAKRYERGNPIHKNDRQTISLASTRCHCRKTCQLQFLLSYTPFIAKLSVSRNFFSSYLPVIARERSDRGNPIHKNDRQTISLASTRCHCRKTCQLQFLLSYTPFIAKLSVSRNFFSSYLPVIAREQREALRTRQSPAIELQQTIPIDPYPSATSRYPRRLAAVIPSAVEESFSEPPQTRNTQAIIYSTSDTVNNLKKDSLWGRGAVAVGD